MNTETFSDENKMDTSRRKKRSPMWNHFSKLGDKRAQCKHCSRMICLSAGSVGNLSRHMRTIHPSISIVSERQLSPDQEMNTSTGKKRSLMWNHFSDLKDKKVRCTHCFQVMSIATGSVGNMNRHMRTKHPSICIVAERQLSLDQEDSECEIDDVSLSEVAASSLEGWIKKEEAETNTTISEKKRKALYDNIMGFLDEAKKPRRKSSNNSDKSDDDENDDVANADAEHDELDDHDYDGCDSDCEDDVNPLEMSSEYFNDTKNGQSEPFEEKLLKNKQVKQATNSQSRTTDKFDPNKYFLLSLLPEMQKLNDRDNFKFRLGVMNVLEQFICKE